MRLPILKIVLSTLPISWTAMAQDPQVEATSAGATSAGATSAQTDLKASSADGDSELVVEGRVGLGFALPAIADDFTDTYNPGGFGMGELGLGFDELHLSLGLSYARLPLNTGTQADTIPPTMDGDIVTGINVDAGALNLLALQLIGRYDFLLSELSPYLIFGGGVAFALPETTTLRVTTEDDEGNAEVTEREVDPDNSVDPTAMLGLGAYYDAGFYDIFGQIHANVLFGDEVVPIAIVTVGVGF